MVHQHTHNNKPPYSLSLPRHKKTENGIVYGQVKIKTSNQYIRELGMFQHLFGSQPKPTKTKFEFKLYHTFENRKKESERLRNNEKWKNHIPVIVEKSDVVGTPDISKKKILVQEDVTIAQFLHTLRRFVKIDSTQAMFIFVDGSHIPQLSDTMGSIYEKHADKDGFLYLSYTLEQAFGH